MDTEGRGTSSEMQTASVPVFGARKKAKELAAQVNELREQLDRLGGLTVLELESKRDALQVEITHQREQLETEKSEAARAVEEQAAEASAALSAQLAAGTEERAALEEKLASLKEEIVVTEEVALLQEAGVYEYNHPLEDSVEYQDALKGIREQIKAMTKRDGGAVKGEHPVEGQRLIAARPKNGPGFLEASTSRLQRRGRQPRSGTQALQTRCGTGTPHESRRHRGPPRPNDGHPYFRRLPRAA